MITIHNTLSTAVQIEKITIDVLEYTLTSNVPKHLGVIAVVSSKFTNVVEKTRVLKDSGEQQ